MLNEKMNRQRLLYEAIAYANEVHRNQKRKMSQTPYIIHPLHGIMLLMSHGVSLDTDNGLTILQAMALHDALEDNPKEVSVGIIEAEFGHDVADVVEGVTLDPANPDKRLARKKILEQPDWRIKIVKVADILSNTIGTTCSILKVGLGETQKHFKQPILERVAMEREFLKNPSLCGENSALIGISRSALIALNELEPLV